MVRTKLPVISRCRAAALLLLVTIAGCGSSDPAPRLLLLVTVDTLRADRLGAYGSERGITPNLDSLAERSQLFEAAFAPTSFTLPSIGALLTGRHPEEIGILGNRSALAPSIPTLATALRESGWTGAAVVGNLVLRRNAGLAAGFEIYDDDMQDLESARNWPERTARDTTDAAISLLDELSESQRNRLFLWVHYQDPHGPYTPPEGFRERFLERERSREDGARLLPKGTGSSGRGRLPAYQVIGDQREVAFYRAGYDGEVHYLDSEIGRLLGELAERIPSEHTIVAFTADHGESLGEHDYWFAHGDRLDDDLVRVPLMLHVPGLEPSRRGDIASLLDVHPTLLRLAGTGPATSDTPGRDLLAADARAQDSLPYLATLRAGGPIRFGLVADGHKFVMTRGKQGWQRELFRLGYEDRNLVDSDPERADALHEKLVTLRRGLRRAPPTPRRQLSEQDQQNLRALGYIEAPQTMPSD